MWLTRFNLSPIFLFDLGVSFSNSIFRFYFGFYFYYWFLCIKMSKMLHDFYGWMLEIPTLKCCFHPTIDARRFANVSFFSLYCSLILKVQRDSNDTAKMTTLNSANVYREAVQAVYIMWMYYVNKVPTPKAIMIHAIAIYVVNG